MSWVRSIPGFRDFLSLVIVCAPDDFPVEDYLKPEEQLTLESAFCELHKGLEILSKSRDSKADPSELFSLLEASHQAYLAGQDILGAHLLQDLERKAFS